MVCDDADGNIRFFIFLIDYTCQTAHVVTERFHRIDIKDGIHVLYSRSKTLQSHSGIDILLLQLTVIAVAVIIKLGEDIVPDFHVTVTLATYSTVWPAAAVLLATVIVNLRTWPTWSGTVLPEIILFSKLEDPLGRNPNLFVPDLKRLVIIYIYGRIQTIRIKTHHLS